MCVSIQTEDTAVNNPLIWILGLLLFCLLGCICEKREILTW